MPSPSNTHEIYLKSLKALGLNPLEHDIRFVEDDWESPTLGAAGLGWEIWLDGMEITQFTYFQQAGGIDLDEISVEITYGLERIAMYIQNKDNVFDIEWKEGITYGDIFKRSEWEWSKYNFELADVDMLFQTYEMFERESRRMIEEGLIFPAYDYLLKCSHVFNILDARGTISVQERARYIRRMNNLARKIAKLYIQVFEND